MSTTPHQAHLIDANNIGTIVIADDHPMFRHALFLRVTADYPSALVLQADSLDRLQELLTQHNNIDLILLDLNMPGSHGLSSLIHVRAIHPALSIVVVSANEEPTTIRRALQLGAAGFIPKSSSLEKISSALAQVFAGSRYVPSILNDLNVPALSDAVKTSARKISSLTPQQFRIASMLAQGMLNKQIAWLLKITEATVKVHMRTIMEKLDVRNRTQVALLFQTFDESTHRDQ